MMPDAVKWIYVINHINKPRSKRYLEKYIEDMYIDLVIELNVYMDALDIIDYSK